MKNLFTIILILFSLSFANAEPVGKYDSMYNDCLRKERGQIDRSGAKKCSEKVYQASQSEIEALYTKRLLDFSEKSPSDSIKLEQSQKSWEVYRNKHCELETNHGGANFISYCLLRLNALRVYELKDLFFINENNHSK